MASKPEEWEGLFEGSVYRGACGSRDVIIVSASECPQDPALTSRKNGELTKEDMARLASESIPKKDWQDDVKLMEARYRRDPARYRDIIIEKDPKSEEYLLGRIQTVFNNTESSGVLIHYIGPGRQATGDWCCKDGSLSFQDLMSCYSNSFAGNTLDLICDCSYSGKWIQLMEEHLDTKQIQPCGHCARSAKVQLSIATSCQADEVPHEMCFSVNGCGNDKNNGKFYIRRAKIAVDQRCDYRNNTELICRAGINDPCQLRRDCTWRDLYLSRRLMLIDIESSQWVLLVCVDDKDTMDKIRSQQIDDNQEIDFGEVIRDGNGKEPSAEVKKWIDQEYPGHACF